LTLNLELTEIVEYTLNIYYTFKEIASHKNIDYKFSVSPDKWELYIDHNKIEKIIYNLLSNAFKFTPDNGSIELRVEKNINNDSCVISVKDSGIGIPKEKQNMLFNRFMQVNFSAEGTGVGLSLVKEFTEAHKGKVWYEENPEGGSIFRVELPVSTFVYKDVNYVNTQSDHMIHDSEHETELEEKETLRHPSPHEWRILIIDDNKDIRDFLSEELGKHFVTQTAENGMTGLEMAVNNNPDLVICDVKMPKMDGIEVTNRLKNDFQTSHIPIILLTALSSDAFKLKGSECGADAYIMKPFSLKYLLSRVYKLIEQREKLKRRFSIDIDIKENLLSNTDKDKEFYILINKILDENINKPAFSIEDFTELSGQKRTIFYKKIKGLTGYSPNELVKIKRMKRAAELLLEGKHTVAEVSWQVGIEDPFYFSKCFKVQFGCSPSKYCITSNNELATEQNEKTI
ncbi:MAG: response regulator, partial [Bacteroidales bacterium]|nr:response regulator [Bacteroidales bacterium]